MTSTAPPTPPGPARLTAAQWSGRLAGIVGRGAPDTDPRVIECRAALAYWRCANRVTADRAALDATGRDALAALLAAGDRAVAGSAR